MTLSDLHLQGKRALVRVDFSVPLDNAQNVTDDTRIRRAIPTIQALLDGGARGVDEPPRPSQRTKRRAVFEAHRAHLVRPLGNPVVAEDTRVGDKALDVTQSFSQVKLPCSRTCASTARKSRRRVLCRTARRERRVRERRVWHGHRAHANGGHRQVLPGDKAFGLLMAKWRPSTRCCPPLPSRCSRSSVAPRSAAS